MKKIALISCCIVAALSLSAFAACSKGEKYSLTFYTNGGTDIAAYELKKGETIPVPEAPSKDYFTFEGWFQDSGLEEPFVLFGEPMPAQDLSAYASWLPDESVKVSYDAQGGSEVAPSVGVIGSAFVQPAEPVREGYKFGGWYTDAAGANPYAFTVFPKENIVLYAKWVNDPAYVYVTYNGNGRELAKVPVKKGETVREAALFGEDIVNTGWYTDEAMTREFAFGGAASENVALYTSYQTEGLAVKNGVVTGYEGTSKNVIVPAVSQGRAVTEIAERAFIGQDIETLVLPDGIAAVGREAFYGCEYLVSVNLGVKLRSIGEYAFYGNTRLKEYGDITSVTVVPEGLFLGCEKLPSVVLSERATSVGAQAFADCLRITEMTLPAGVKEVSDNLFSGCVALERVVLPAAMETLGKGVFSGCVNLTEVALDGANKTFSTRDSNLYRGNELVLYVSGDKAEESFQIPANVVSVAEGAFANNKNLKEVVVRSADTAVECGAFADMRALEALTVPSVGDGAENDYLAYLFGAPARETAGGRSLYIPETLQSVTIAGGAEKVGDYAFYGALGLREIKGLAAVSEVGDYAFAYTALETFEVPANMTSFGEGAFAGCHTLKEYTLGESALYSVVDGCLYDKDGTRLVSVPSGKTDIVFGEDLKKIESYAFTGSLVSEVVVPETVESIGFNAFNGCNYLEKITVPFIGDGTDKNYLPYIFGASVSYSTAEDGGYGDIRIINSDRLPGNLKTVAVSKPLAKVPDFAFYAMTSLENVELQPGVQEYGAYSFSVTGVKEMTFEEGVKIIGDYAFMQCMSLTSVTFPSSLEKAGEGSFALDLNLQNIVFSEGLKEIPELMFYAYTETDPSTGNSINSSALNGTIVIPASVETIGEFAFFGAGVAYDSAAGGYVRNAGFGVEFAEGSKLRTIGPSVFTYSGLERISIPATVETIGLQSFAENNYLEEVIVGSAEEGSALKLIDEIAFGWNEVLENVTIYAPTAPQMNLKEYQASATSTIYLNAFYLSEAVKIYVPAAAYESYLSAENWSELKENVVSL